MNVLSTEYQQVFVLLKDFIFLIYKYMCLMCHKSILWWGIIFISNMFFVVSIISRFILIEI